MAEIIMPKMGDAMTEGKVVRWYKKAGDAVKKGEPVLEIETDKVNLDLEAEQDGTLGDVAAEEGKMVEVGGVLATILGAGEKAQPKKETAAPPAEEAPARRAIDKKDSIKKSTGDYAEAIETKEIPLTAMRRTIAKRLAESTGPIPHFYLTAEYDVTNLLSLREQVNEIAGIKTSVNDFIVRAAALALRHHPNVNASWGDEAITQHGEIHIGIAVSTPEGLITPVVRNADQKSVTDISNEVRALADKAKNRKLTPNDYQGSTFTISNLGAWGIDQFTAIINPPNVAILAIGAASAQPVVIDRQVVIRDRMKVTMSCDHRVVDGALGAEYLRTLRSYIEQPVRLVL